MINNIDDREYRVMDFINAKNKELANMNKFKDINNNPEIKLRKLGDEANNGTSICLDRLLGKIYKDALPFNDPKKNCSDDDAGEEMRAFIANRTNGKKSEYYIREAIKRNNSSTLKGMLTEAKKISKKFYKEKSKDIGSIDISSLNFNIDDNKEELNKISKNLELDEISSIIRDNVQKAIKDESDKAKREEEYNKMIEDSLANDPNVTDDASLESAVDKLNPIKTPSVYQPSLFEAIMLGKANVMKESTGEDILTEAMHEYTKLNIVKALKLESFSLDSIKKMSDKYLLG